MANSKASKTSKTSKTSKVNSELQDAIRPNLVQELLDVAGGTAEAEFVVWRKFAELAESGELSVRGFKAHLAEASDKGAEFATLKAGHAQHLTLMLSLSELAESPRNVAKLYTLADRLVRNAPETKGVSKSDTARKAVKTAKSKGAKFGTLDSKTPKQDTSRKARPAGSNGKVESVKLDVKTIESLETLVTKLDLTKVSEELNSALIGLMTALQVKFDA